MQLAGYIAKGTWHDQLIRIWTGGPVSHTELIFSDGMWFTSSPRDGGVRMRRIEPLPGHWVIYDLPTPPLIEAIVRAWAETRSQELIKYDMTAVILKHGLSIPWDDPKKWMCSEACVRALQQGYMLPDLTAADVTPMQLINQLDLRRYPHYVS